MSYICMLIWCGVMMLITSVAISCCRVIAGSTSVCLRMLGVAEDSDSDERRRDSARLQPPQIYITVPPSSLSLFHLSALLHRWAPDLNSSLSPVRLGKYIIQSARAPCLWLEPQTYTYAFTHEKKKVTHNQRMQIRVCVCKRSSTWHLGAFSALARERSAGRCFGATCFKFLGPFWICAKELERILPLRHLLLLPA